MTIDSVQTLHPVEQGPNAQIVPELRGSIFEMLHNARHKAMVTAGVLIAGATLGLTGCSSDGAESDSINKSATTAAEGREKSGVDIGDACNAKPYAADKLHAYISFKAAEPLETLADKTKDLDAVKQEYLEKTPKNDLLLAAASVLLDNQNNAVDYATLQTNMDVLLRTITDGTKEGDARRDEVCAQVIGAALSIGARTAANEVQYLEVVAVYNDNNVFQNQVNFVEPDVRDSIEGFWFDDKGKVVQTADGRVFMAKNLGNQTDPTTLDPNGQPTVSINPDGTETHVRLLPDGKIETQVKDKDGNNIGKSVVSAGPSGGNQNKPDGQGPNGSGPICGQPGQSACEGPAGGQNPVNPAPAPGPAPAPSPAPAPAPGPAPNTSVVTAAPPTLPPMTIPIPPTTRPPETTAVPTTTTPKGTPTTVPGTPN